MLFFSYLLAITSIHIIIDNQEELEILSHSVTNNIHSLEYSFSSLLLLNRIINSKLGRVLFQVYINGHIVFSDYFVFSNSPSFSSTDLLYLPSTIPTTQYLTVLTDRNGHVFMNNKEVSIICIGRQSYSISSILFSIPSFYQIIVQDANYHILANKTIRIVLFFSLLIV